MKTRSLLLGCIIVLAVGLSGFAGHDGHGEIVSVAKSWGIEEKLSALDLDLLMERNGRIFIVAGAEGLMNLARENIPFVFETHRFHPFNPETTLLKGGINGQYHSYRELETELMRLENAFPHLAKLHRIGQSLEKRYIYALKISRNVHLNENKPAVIFLGCHHAREWISVEIPLMFGKHLFEVYDSNPEVRRLIDQSEIWIVPMTNPDGLEYSIHVYRYWRKNRRANKDGSFGVDLNRNYGYKWGLDDKGSSSNPSSVVFRGEAPFSEPEAQAVRNLFTQKKFEALVSYHSYSQLILYPWGHTGQPTERDEELEALSEKMSRLIQSVWGNIYKSGRAGSTLYLTNGDTTDWSFGTYGIPSFTVELPPVDILGGGFFNPEEEIDPIFRENLPAMLFLVDWAVQNFRDRKEAPDGHAEKPGYPIERSRPAQRD